MPDYDLLIKGGQVVLPGRIAKLDVAVLDGKIFEVAKGLKGSAAQEIKAGKFSVLPSFLDADVVLGGQHETTLAEATAIHARGGGSWFADMPGVPLPCLTPDEFETKRELLLAASRTDFSLWAGLTSFNFHHLDALAEAGAIGFKAALCDGAPGGLPACSPEDLKAGMEVAAKHGLIVAVHTESQAHLDNIDEDWPAPPGIGPDAYNGSRPVGAEVRGALLACGLAKETGARLHILHCSCAEVAGIAADAREEDGVDVTVESCPHYALFDETRTLADGGATFKTMPPLRRRWAVDALWDEFGEGSVDTLASHHITTDTATEPSDDFFAAPTGIAGWGHAYAALLSDANLRAFPLVKIAAMTSSHVAARLGLADRKGQLAPGMDADFTLVEFSVDPSAPEDASAAPAYAGHPVAAKVIATYCRGHEISGETAPENFVPQFLKPHEEGRAEIPTEPSGTLEEASTS